MKCVILESPYRVDRTRTYLQECIRDCLRRGEAPFASHQMYTDALDDDNVQDRTLGISAGFAWHDRADYVVVYEDLGVSPGMQEGIDHAQGRGLRVDRRRIR